jgi:hypothetical protein
MLELPNRDEEVLDSVDDAVGLGFVMAAWPTRIEAAAPSTAAAAASSTSLPQARNLLLPAAMEEGAASHARHWSRAKAKVNRRTEGSTFFVGRESPYCIFSFISFFFASCVCIVGERSIHSATLMTLSPCIAFFLLVSEGIYGSPPPARVPVRVGRTIYRKCVRFLVW